MTDQEKNFGRVLTQPPEGTAATFLGAPYADQLAAGDADFVVIGLPFGSPYKMRQVHYGASDAPRAIRDRSMRLGAMLNNYDFDIGCAFSDLNIHLRDCGDVIGHPGDIQGNNTRATEAVRRILDARAVPVVLGGDDSITALSIGAFERFAPITVIQIDAHIDYRHEVDGVTTGYSSPMRRAAEMPWVDRIIHVGTRGIGSAHRNDVEDTLKRGNKIVTANEFRISGTQVILDSLPQDRNLYVALDCDGLDPSVMPGTSAPVPGGLRYEDVAGLFLQLGKKGRLVGFNVAEHYPSLDINQITALGITRLIMILLAGRHLANHNVEPTRL
jgi:agmatinase